MTRLFLTSVYDTSGETAKYFAKLLAEGFKGEAITAPPRRPGNVEVIDHYVEAETVEDLLKIAGIVGYSLVLSPASDSDALAYPDTPELTIYDGFDP